MQREPSYKDTKRLLAQVREKLEREKWLSIGLIAIGWLISIRVGTTQTQLTGGIGGFVSGAVIWWGSLRSKQSEVSQQVLRLLLFISIGVVAELILGWIIDQSLNFLGENQIKPWITAFLGAGISVGVMTWQIRRQVFRV